AGRRACALNFAVFERPSIRGAIHINEIRLAERFPIGTVAVNERFGERRVVGSHHSKSEESEHNRAEGNAGFHATSVTLWPGGSNQGERYTSPLIGSGVVIARSRSCGRPVIRRTWPISSSVCMTLASRLSLP